MRWPHLNLIFFRKLNLASKNISKLHAKTFSGSTFTYFHTFSGDIIFLAWQCTGIEYKCKIFYETYADKTALQKTAANEFAWVATNEFGVVFRSFFGASLFFRCFNGLQWFIFDAAKCSYHVTLYTYPLTLFFCHAWERERERWESETLYVFGRNKCSWEQLVCECSI